MNERLWYKNEATYWCDALPLGNGRIGAMVFSGVQTEHISLNEDTLWSGVPRNHVEEGRYEFYEKARNLALEGKYKESQQCIEENITGAFTESYMPLGDLYLDMHYEVKEEERNYYRELDVSSAICTCEYEMGDTKYTRQTIVSAPDQALVLNLSASKKNLSFTLRMDSLLRHSVVAANNAVELEGLCPSHAVPVYIKDVIGDDGIIYREGEDEIGIRFRAVSAVNTNGTLKVHKDSITVENADYAKIIFTVRSNFAGFDKFPEKEKKEYIQPAQDDAKKILTENFEILKDRHIKDYQKLYNAFSFNPECKSFDEQDTLARITNYNITKEDGGLVLLLLNFGRYLMIASSRAGTQATHLQAIWNNLLRAPWSSNYTLNINTEMNYWASFACGLGELTEPLVNLIKNLSIVGRGIAKEYYNARGFASNHNTDIWAHANPVGMRRSGGSPHDYWPMSGGWLMRNLFEVYEYTLDKDFLKNTAYPIIKSAAEFYLDILVTDSEGKRVFAASTSPENNFIIDGDRLAVSKTTAMTVAIIRDVFEIALQSTDILGVDQELAEKMKEELSLFPEFTIGKDGRLLEWLEELVEYDPVHRHVSHLYPLYPSNQITPEKTALLAKACAASLETRTDDGTGWSRAWKICLWARLYDGERAYKLLQGQLNFIDSSMTGTQYTGGGTYPNLFGAHPPFQIDGNFGVLAGMIEMLIQNKDGVLHIFKALPDAWKTGTLKGLRAKNGLSLDITWVDKNITSLLVHSACDQSITISTVEKDMDVFLKTGANTVI